MAKKRGVRPRPALNRGRVQAQSQHPSHPCEKSVAWGQDIPPTKAEMLAMLAQLWSGLTDAERQDREVCLQMAERFIQNAPATGYDDGVEGCFRNRAVRGGVRIDIEIHAGRACTG